GHGGLPFPSTTLFRSRGGEVHGGGFRTGWRNGPVPAEASVLPRPFRPVDRPERCGGGVDSETPRRASCPLRARRSNPQLPCPLLDRKSTRLNSSHVKI